MPRPQRNTPPTRSAPRFRRPDRAARRCAGAAGRDAAAAPAAGGGGGGQPPRPAAARRLAAASAWALLLSAAGGAPALAQLPSDAALQRLIQDTAYSLFVLTGGSFTAGGTAERDGPDALAKFNVYNVPLRQTFDTGLLGPVQVRLATGYGEATVFARTRSALGDAPTGDRFFLHTWNARLQFGRPVELAPGLVFAPFAGFGYAHWNGKFTQDSVGPAPAQIARADLWVDALLYEAFAFLEYRRRWRELGITPGLSVNFTHIGSTDGRNSVSARPGAGGERRRADLLGNSVVLRAALRVDGPLGTTGPALGGFGLRWQAFTVASYETGTYGLFPWSVEFGGALGIEPGRLGRGRLSFDPGSFFVGASYIVGENLSGVRANFGFRF